jgi:hypothetical protein
MALSLRHKYTAVDILAYVSFFCTRPCVCGALLLCRPVTGPRDAGRRRGLNRAGQNIINHGWLVDSHVT